MTPAASRESSQALGLKKRCRATPVPLPARIDGLVRQCDQKRQKDRVPQEWFCTQHSGNRWSLGCRGFSSWPPRLEGSVSILSNLPGRSWEEWMETSPRLGELVAASPSLAG